MKKQIKRLSPHQNGKVFGILFALGSLPFLTLMILTMFLSMPDVDQHGNPIGAPFFILVLFPLFYLIFAKMGSGLAMKHPAAICSSVDVSLQDPQPGYLFK